MENERDVPHEFKLVQQLLSQQEVIMRALLYLISNEKSDVERDDIKKYLKIHTQSRNERIFTLPVISEDIDYVIEKWTEECGPKNRWIKALKGFAEMGGNIKWYSGYPHTGAVMSFVLISPEGEELRGHRLKDIQDYTMKFKKSFIARAAINQITRRELLGR
jgi:hypothetical protein